MAFLFFGFVGCAIAVIVINGYRNDDRRGRSRPSRGSRLRGDESAAWVAADSTHGIHHIGHGHHHTHHADDGPSHDPGGSDSTGDTGGCDGGGGDSSGGGSD